MAFSFFLSPIRSLLTLLVALLHFPLASHAAPPLQFVSGGARQIGNSIGVAFITLQQQNITHFSILHSPEGRFFEPISEMPVSEDHVHPSSYSITYKNEGAFDAIQGGWNHFRVKAHDAEGRIFDLFQDSVYYTLPSTPVYPGDVNSDGHVNSWDFVHLCSVLGKTGPSRPSATISPTLQPAPDWSEAFFDGANYKHADCNGDGVVDMQDAVAIRANYGELVVSGLRLGGCGGYAMRLEYPDSAGAGDTVNIEIFLGEAGNPIPDAYGFVLGFACHNEHVAPTFVEFSLDSSWLGTPGADLAVFSRDELINQGWCDIAVSRTDGMQRSGEGRVACLSIVMVDDIAKDELERLLAPRIQTGLVLTPTLRDVSWGDPDAEVEGVHPEFAGMGPVLLQENEIRFYPNPTYGPLVIEGALDTYTNNTKTVEIFDWKGTLLHRSQFTGEKAQMLVDFLLPGAYMFKVSSANNTVVKRVIKQ